MYHSDQNWAFSSTGNFMDNDLDADNYIATNTSKLSMPDLQLYTTARLSPLSLTYYGLCLVNGNYTIKLHFAEIIFTDDNTFTSLGRRIFNVFIQGKLVLRDFNIEDAAGGPGKAVVKTFTTVVTSHTLEIHLYWAGKGTTSIPSRGVYGPLISAISVDPNFTPPSFSEKKEYIKLLSTVLAPVSFLIFLALVIIWRKGWLGGKGSKYEDLRGLDLQIGAFTLKQIKAATKNFDPANKIGEGGFGSVYKGLLSDGTVIAVKQLSSKSKQGNREFVNEIGMISGLQHPNLVKLYGCCIEGHQLMLIYEYMENNCLARALFGQVEDKQLKLDWPTRRKICLGIARGLAYLHEESRLKIVHRDIKGSNILLDKDLNAKISDFGLAKLDEGDNSHISTRVAGTIGYMAPEYAMRGYLTYKADVYSFGVVALEIVSGKSNTNYRPKEEFVYLLDWAYVLQERGNLLELVDPNLGSDFSAVEATQMLNVALLCTNAAPTLRPTMSSVVSMLEGQTIVQPPLSDHRFSSTGSRFRSNRTNFWQCPSQLSTDYMCTDSSETSIGKDEATKAHLQSAKPLSLSLLSSLPAAGTDKDALAKFLAIGFASSCEELKRKKNSFHLLEGWDLPRALILSLSLSLSRDLFLVPVLVPHPLLEREDRILDDVQLQDYLILREITVTSDFAVSEIYVWNQEASEWVPTLVILRLNRAALCVQWSPRAHIEDCTGSQYPKHGSGPRGHHPICGILQSDLVCLFIYRSHVHVKASGTYFPDFIHDFQKTSLLLEVEQKLFVYATMNRRITDSKLCSLISHVIGHLV
ncbi:hypothetical protein ACLOJK_008657 [Asimina triloba]